MQGLPVYLSGALRNSFSEDSHALNTVTASFSTRWAVCMGRPAKKSGLLFARITASSARYESTRPTFTFGYAACIVRSSLNTSSSFCVRSSFSHPVNTWRIRNSAAL